MVTVRDTTGATVHLDASKLVAIVMPAMAGPGTPCQLVLTGVMVAVEYMDALQFKHDVDALAASAALVQID